MFKIIKGLPKNVLGVEAHGKITDADYQKVLIPHANEMLAKHPLINVLYVAGKDFKGYDSTAVWGDEIFGLNHWSNFNCIAVVTDVTWLRTAVHLFSPLFPGALKIFDLSDLSVAKDWIAKNKIVTTKKKTDVLKRELVVPVLYNIRHTVQAEEKRMDKARAPQRKKARN
jgi:hypothetical protein